LDEFADQAGQRMQVADAALFLADDVLLPGAVAPGAGLRHPQQSGEDQGGDGEQREAAPCPGCGI
jgi:hypothetical protein